MTDTKVILLRFIPWAFLFSIVAIISVADFRIKSSDYIPRNYDDFIVYMMEIASESRIVTDEKGKILFASESAARIAGYTPGELKGQDLEILMPERYKKDHRRAVLSALQRHDGKIVTAKCHLLMKDKSERPVEISTRVRETGIGIIMMANFTPIEMIEKVGEL